MNNDTVIIEVVLKSSKSTNKAIFNKGVCLEMHMCRNPNITLH